MQGENVRDRPVEGRREGDLLSEGNDPAGQRMPTNPVPANLADTVTEGTEHRLLYDLGNRPGRVRVAAGGVAVAGEIWALPLPEALYVKTEVDLETGNCELRE